MECCQAVDQIGEGMVCRPFFSFTVRPWVGAAGNLLNYLFSTEASDGEYPQPGPLRPAWMGPLKGLVWTANSIAIGAILAWLCG